MGRWWWSCSTHDSTYRLRQTYESVNPRHINCSCPLRHLKRRSPLSIASVRNDRNTSEETETRIWAVNILHITPPVRVVLLLSIRKHIAEVSNKSSWEAMLTFWLQRRKTSSRHSDLYSSLLQRLAQPRYQPLHHHKHHNHPVDISFRAARLPIIAAPLTLHWSHLGREHLTI